MSIITGNKKKAEEFGKEERNASKALNAIFYNDVEKAWFDYNLRTKSHNILFYPTVAVPLFTGCYSTLDYDKSAKVIDFINVTFISFFAIFLTEIECCCTPKV